MHLSKSFDRAHHNVGTSLILATRSPFTVLDIDWLGKFDDDSPEVIEILHHRCQKLVATIFKPLDAVAWLLFVLDGINECHRIGMSTPPLGSASHSVTVETLLIGLEELLPRCLVCIVLRSK